MKRKISNSYERSDGIIQRRFSINGKRYAVYGKNQKEVLQKEQELRKSILDGTYIANKNLTLDQWFEEWEKMKSTEIKGSSMRVYKNQYKNHISKSLGKKRLQSIEKRQIRAMLDGLPESLSAETYNSILRVIKLILNDAVREEILLRNPAAGIKGRKKTNRASETYHRALTVEEQKIFMEEMKQDFYYEFVSLLITTGMRIGEVAALEVTDIDYEKSVIQITKTMTTNVHGKTIVGSTPKSSSSQRSIPLNETILSVIKSQLAKMELLKQANIIDFSYTRLFATPYGNMPSNEVINKAIEAAINRLADKNIYMEKITAHALRDTFATRYIEQGGTPQTLKTILGHKSLALTMDLYAHVLDNTKQKEMEQVKIII